MTDITNPTGNVTLWDDNGNPIAVTLNAVSGLYELRVKDKDVLDKLGLGLDASIRNTPWQYWSEVGKTFIVPYTATLATRNTEYDIFLLINPNATGKDLHIHELTLGTSTQNMITMNVYRNPTVTVNGTAQTPRDLKSSNGAGVATTFTLPTVTSRGTLLETILVGATAQFSNTYVRDYQLGLHIEPNEKLLITLNTSANSATCICGVEWAEVTQGAI